MSCQARKLGKAYVIPGTDIPCHTGAECGAPASKKITVDDGDASFKICSACFKRFLTKGSKAETWLGWFDCDIPPLAHIKGSAWYWGVVKEAHEKLKKDPVLEANEQLAKMTVKEKPLEAVKSVQDQIAEIETWLKGEGKVNFKEQPKKYKELIRLKALLKS